MQIKLNHRHQDEGWYCHKRVFHTDKLTVQILFQQKNLTRRIVKIKIGTQFGTFEEVSMPYKEQRLTKNNALEQRLIHSRETS